MAKIQLPVEEIKAKIAAGATKAQIAKDYGVAYITLYRILKADEEKEKHEETAQLEESIEETTLKTNVVIGDDSEKVIELPTAIVPSPAEKLRYTYILVDTENGCNYGIESILKRVDTPKLCLYHTKNSGGLLISLVEWAVQHPTQIEFIPCTCGKPNALDFQIVTDLGYKISKDPEAKYILLTKDTGFDAAIDFWKRRGIDVVRVTNDGKEQNNEVEIHYLPSRSASCNLGIFLKKYKLKANNTPALANYIIERHKNNLPLESAQIRAWANQDVADLLVNASKYDIEELVYTKEYLNEKRKSA